MAGDIAEEGVRRGTDALIFKWSMLDWEQVAPLRCEIWYRGQQMWLREGSGGDDERGF